MKKTLRLTESDFTRLVHKIINEQILNQTDESARNETMKYLIQIAKLQAGMLTGAELNAFVNKSIDNI